MSSVSSLSAGVQQLYNDGLLPSGVNPSTLNGASAAQLNKMASSSMALQEVGTLFGTDTASLSSAASAPDPLTAAVDNLLTSSLNAAAKQFLPPSSTTTGSNINLLA